MFTVEEDSKKIIATIPGGRRGEMMEKYECVISACINPVCTCGTVHLDFTPAPGASENDDPLTPHRVNIDIVKRKLDLKGKIPKPEKKFAKKVLSELTKKDFNFLLNKYLEYKNKITEEAGPEDIDGYFDYEEIERDGLMSTYNAVMPFADRIRFEIGGVDYTFFDMYCVLPDCSCTRTNLDIKYTLKKEYPDKEICSISLDYKKKRWEEYEGDFSTIPLKTIKSGVMRQIPDFYKILMKRHQRLKAIYVHCREKEYTPKQPVQQRKIGRNAPCPCGSGKKYKKCCMRKQV